MTESSTEAVRDSSNPKTNATMRFVGLGDSLTQGVGDPSSGRAGFAGELDGWVSYLASAIRASGQPVEVCNVAVAGARLEHVIDEQLQRALYDSADVMSCFIGINDLWDANLDLHQFDQRFRKLFGALTSHSPIVITATIHDVFAPLPVRAPLREKLARNIATMNDTIRAAVADYGLVLVDLAAQPETFTSAVRAVDRLHPNRYGHQLIAAEVVRELHNRGLFLGIEPPIAAPIRRGAHDLAHIAWISTYVRRNWRRWRAEMESQRQQPMTTETDDSTREQRDQVH